MTQDGLVEKVFALALDDLAQFSPELAGAATPEATEARAVASYRLGDHATAATLFGSLPAKHPFQPRSLVLRMRLQLAAGDTAAALDTARAILDADSGNLDALRTAGRIYNSARDYDHADRYWRQLTEVQPDDGEAALQVARIAARRNEWDSVALYADMARKVRSDHEPLSLQMEAALRIPGSEALMAESLPLLYPHDARAVRRYFTILLARQPEAQIAAAASAIVRDHPQDFELSELVSAGAHTWIMDAQIAEMNRDDEKASALYKAARALDPRVKLADEGLARLVRGRVVEMRDALKAGDNASAERLARKVQDIDTLHGEAAFVRGRVYLATDPELAAEQFATCVAVEPENGFYCLNLARAQAKSNRFLEAYDTFGRVLLTDTHEAYRNEAEMQRPQMINAMVRQGSALYAEEAFAEALEIFAKTRAVEEFAERSETMLVACRRGLLARAKALYADDDPSLVKVAEPLTRHWPDNPQVWQILGRSHMGKRNYPEALVAWQRLAELEPDNAHVHLQVARCFSWLKRPEDATRAARKVLSLDPSIEEARQIEERMAAQA